MDSRMSLRSSLMVTLLLSGFIVTTPFLSAQTKKLTARYAGTAANMKPGAGESLRFDLLEWSSDADREQMIGAFKDKGDSGLQSALEAARTLGFIWSDSAVGHSVRYAHRIALPDGGERIIVATNVRLGRGGMWKPTAASGSTDYPFTVIELRLNRRGEGEGKMSFTSKVAVEDQAKTIGLTDYAASPVLITGVKREIGAGDGKSATAGP
jgi:hypothetical protein